MKANTVLIKTRHYLQDLQSVKFSDWEIYQGISDALRIFAEEAARMHDGAGIFSSVISLTMSGDSALLPENYIRIKRAYGATGNELLRVITDTPGEGEFAIRGGSIMSGEPTITLHYFSFPGKVDQPEDVIDLPDSMAVPLARITSLLLANKIDEAVALADYFSGTTFKKQEIKEVTI